MPAKGRGRQENAEAAECFLLSVIPKSLELSYMKRDGHPPCVLDLTKA